MTRSGWLEKRLEDIFEEVELEVVGWLKIELSD